MRIQRMHIKSADGNFYLTRSRYASSTRTSKHQAFSTYEYCTVYILYVGSQHLPSYMFVQLFPSEYWVH